MVCMLAVQLTKTLFIQAALAYAIIADPGPILLTQPKEEAAENFSRDRLEPMIRDIPELHQRVVDCGKKKSAANTVKYKKFPGGSLSLVGSISPDNWSRRSIRYLFCDEVDKYPRSAGVEGDPIGLGIERTSNFQSRRKIILTCSPTIKGRSRIARAYSESDQRKPWVPCHQCGAFQVLKWSQVKWENSLSIEDRPATAHYECEHCGAKWSDIQRWSACEKSEWRASAPFTGTAGFWISHLYSPWKTLGAMVADFLNAKHSGNREEMKRFVTTVLAELWEEEGVTPQWNILLSRQEDYPFGAEPSRSNDEAVVPRGALFLTCGVDVQHDRLEYEVVGWGRGHESWSVAYGVIRVMDGNESLSSNRRELWDELDKVLARDWLYESGATMPIMVMAIDTGDRSKPVYEFAKRHARPNYGAVGMKIVYPRTVVPIKGSPRESLQLIAGVTKEDAARKRQNIRIVSLGVGLAKQELYDNLQLPQIKQGGTFLPGYCHFPRYGETYFQGLCNERCIVNENGDVSWEKLGRNEPLDTRVYNRGAAAIFGIDRMNESHWAKLERALGLNTEIPEAAAQTASASAPVMNWQQQQLRRQRPQIRLL